MIDNYQQHIDTNLSSFYRYRDFWILSGALYYLTILEVSLEGSVQPFSHPAYGEGLKLI